MVTTIQIDSDTKNLLESMKMYPRETYGQLIMRLIENSPSENVDRESLIESVEIMSNLETMRNIAEALKDSPELTKKNWTRV